MTTPEDTAIEDWELISSINNCSTVVQLNKLRMDVVRAKNIEIRKLWQLKFSERKKKYTFSELMEYTK